MAADPMEPDRLREMLAANLASETSRYIASLRAEARSERESAWQYAGHNTAAGPRLATGWNARANMLDAAADALEENARLRERVAALEAALRTERNIILDTEIPDALVNNSAVRPGVQRLQRINAALSGSTTLAEHDAAVRADERERCVEAARAVAAKYAAGAEPGRMSNRVERYGALEAADAIRALAEGK